jgi:hypothetical protein
MVENEGAALDPVKFAKIVFAAALVRLKLSAGVVVAVATEVVNRGERFPALKPVTVPLPPPVTPSVNRVIVSRA